MLHSSTLRSRRQGVILLVVVSMLTLFAIVGLSFVMYAESEAKGSQYSREAQVQFRPDVDADLLAAFLLGQFVYDVNDDERGVYSSLRGHSLARSMYGWNDTPGSVNIVPFNGVGRPKTGPLPPLLSGSPAFPPGLGPGPQPPAPGQRQYNNLFVNQAGSPVHISDHFLPHYLYHPTDGFLRDPERLGPPLPGYQPGEHAWRTALPLTGQPDNRGPFTGGINVPYTYPDLTSMFLAAVRADGTVLMPSFHRPWLFGPLLPESSNPNWQGNTYGKYLTLRPRPVDQLTAAEVSSVGLPWPLIPENLVGQQPTTLRNLIVTLQAAGKLLPYPEDAGGDVKNLVGNPGPNDSFWIDPGFPVRISPEGIKYKPLFAILVTDLDNRINLNVVGNIRGVDQSPNPEYPALYRHRSNQGWGPWEVNVGKVLTHKRPVNPPQAAPVFEEWTNLFAGDGTRNWMIANSPRNWLGRLGTDKEPSSADAGPIGRMAHYYGQVDLDASGRISTGYASTSFFTIPGQPGVPAPFGQTEAFPNFPALQGWDNGWRDAPASIGPPVNEQLNHPLLYNVMHPRGDDRRFALSNMEALLRYRDTGSPAITSELFQLCPDNFGDTTIDPLNPNTTLGQKRRSLVTVRSFDVDRPGAAPWLYNLEPTNPNTYPTVSPFPAPPSPIPIAGNDPYRAPYGLELAFPNLSWRAMPPPPTPPPPGFNTRPQEFTPNDWRWQPVVADALTRVDLNRKLTAYPLPEFPPSPPNRATYSLRFDSADPANAANVAMFKRAQADRQQFANDIYNRLLSVMGMPRRVLRPPPGVPAIPNDDEAAIRRYLAQIAVNIVDYIDDDDIQTVFNFYTKEDAGDPTFNPADLSEPGIIELPRYWVFGTELPRLVVNEVLFESFRDLYSTTPPPPGESPYQVRAYVELHNPMKPTYPPYPPANPNVRVTFQQQDFQPVRLRMINTVPMTVSSSGTTGAYNVFQVKVAPRVRGVGTTQPLDKNKNVVGTLEGAPRHPTTSNSDFDQNVYLQANPNTPLPANQVQVVPGGFMVLTPDDAPFMGQPGAGLGSDGRDTLQLGTALWMRSPNLQYRLDLGALAGFDERVTGLTVALRRLANPHLPFEPDARAVVGGVRVNEPNPYYNPYVTIDHIGGNPIRHYDSAPTPVPYGSRFKTQPYAASVKLEDPAPPGANGLRETRPHSPIASTPLEPPNPQPTYHTFGQSNHVTTGLPDDRKHPLRGHYDWLTHLDRQLISPMELLHVSGFPPHALTQRFVTTFEVTAAKILAGPNRVVIVSATSGDANGGPWKIENGTRLIVVNPDFTNAERVVASNVTPTSFQANFQNPHPEGSFVLGQQPFNQRLPWLDETAGMIPGSPASHRLYRFLEFVSCGPRAAGVVAGGRIPGKININTIWDRETLRALIDAQPVNHEIARGGFYSSSGNPDVVADGIHAVLMNLNPAQTAAIARTLGPTPGLSDRPFWGLSFGQYPATDLQFPAVPPAGNGIYSSFLRTNQPQQGLHPYLASALPNKIFNHLTTRSNVFAVYVTVGFFEVKDDTTRPVKLGAEIGKAENRHVRHRMFSIVDRTNLSIATDVTRLSGPVVVPPPPLQVTLPVPQTNGVTRSGIPWSIRPGSTIIVDVGSQQEVVVVQPGNMITLTKDHAAGAPISLPDVPGEPPVFLKPTKVEPAIPNDPSPSQFWVEVPASAPQGALGIRGEYDGIEWYIPPDRPVPARWLVDVGVNQEMVELRNAGTRPDPDRPGQWLGRFRVSFATVPDPLNPMDTKPRIPHADPFVITNTLLGNPGPQPRFNPRQAPYSAIVRYLSIIQ